MIKILNGVQISESGGIYTRKDIHIGTLKPGMTQKRVMKEEHELEPEVLRKHHSIKVGDYTVTLHVQDGELHVSSYTNIISVKPVAVNKIIVHIEE